MVRPHADFKVIFFGNDLCVNFEDGDANMYAKQYDGDGSNDLCCHESDHAGDGVHDSDEGSGEND